MNWGSQMDTQRHKLDDCFCCDDKRVTKTKSTALSNDEWVTEQQAAMI